VQPLTIAYKRLGGLPIGRDERARVGWYGDIELTPHLWGIFLAGGLDVELIWGEAQPFDDGTNRKKLAATLETTVRRDLLAALRP
jgi:1-acyl-sn-glycerol-3-phosphate acyltransferase